MPNLDSGRYFLTVLLPIKNGPFIEKGGMNLSPEQAIRDTLSVWATAQQSPATHWIVGPNGKKIHNPRNSHYAQNLKTHFTRIFVIGNTVYNGRVGKDTLINLVKGMAGKKSANAIIPEQVDQLNTAYLAYIAEIDAPKGEESELDDYLKELWTQMSGKFSQLFQYCHGFEKVVDEGTFRDFMRAGQIETVMPFNDYWQSPPQLKGFYKTPYVIPPIIVALAGLWATGVLAWWWLPLTFIATVATLWAVIMAYGSKPLPMAPDSDLPSVLKALFLQQNLIDFAISNQGVDAEKLHAEFGKFLNQHKPKKLNEPTQSPGTIHA